MNFVNSMLFIFSVLIILVPAIAAVVAFLVHKKTAKQTFKYMCWLVLLYMFELISLHYIDFYSFNNGTYISFAPMKIILFALILMTNMFIILRIFNKPIRFRYFLFIIVFIVAQTILKMIPETDLSVWGFYTVRQIFMIALFIFFFVQYFICEDERVKTPARQFFGLFIVFILMNIMIVVEDALISFQQEVFERSALILKERNFTENIFFIAVSILIIYRAVPYLRQLTIAVETGTEAEVSKMSTEFATSIHLTKRESEILGLIANHLSNNEIAEQLYISPGTLKAHIHNIYAKANVSNRNELLKQLYGVEK